MCDTAPPRGTGWRGWIDLPPPSPVVPAGPWIDLSHPVSAAMPRVPMFPPPTIRRLMCLPADPLNVTEFGMVVHTGTHLDAPFHFFNDGPTFEAIPPERLSGTGVVWRLDLPPDSLIEPHHLEAARPRLRPGDILAFDTGWSDVAGTDAYDHHPCLSIEAAAWIVAQRVKLVAFDFATPDLPVHRRPLQGFDWPVHQVLLRDGVLICEHLRGPRPLAGQRAEFVFGALSLAGADGAPARIFARVAREG
ncbi:cyclase family protein [Roseomonas sp. PWR1]|uniref:Cyclase family protein n=1 Tax=Roseomonas nitratireducens TaxID=2820810 RepID=A0ABS4APP9_9PROT|nr:cyclase family protein [Neoroseomonas nitratireducens]MBP0462806.1 cyclase family protein [Neoroseomonas nitratireducens]